ncbi:hypothetical protein PtA15_1A63 [Puccinia triticina]|uniref:Uncharacterized protein n=1 Tax=Puccinia triticina TaxID=208348 RepID=A0ABY7C6G5_9BASI|nr:uncharacterized protein PtA15_1A63 [Puccinia triticina]WAQ80725.1 hypothetical protein PtA15_1A63 [Puccinia triticina]WAR51617.1 hypothetical protein PtB15_1B53 [Puccinia triticina]
MSIEKAKQDQFFNGLYQHLTQLYKGTPSRDEQGILRGGRIVSHEDWAIFRAREALDTKIHEYQDAVHDKTHSNKELDAQLDEISKSLSLIDKKIISQAEKSEKETPHRPVGSFNPGDDLSQEAASINFMKLMHKDCIEEVIKSERSFINNLGYFTGYHLQWIEAAVRAKLAMASEGMGLLDYQSLKRLIRHIHRQECFRALINIINSHRLP